MNLWRNGDNIRDKEQEKRNCDWSDKVYPGRCQNIEEWMIKSKYTGDFKEVQKNRSESQEGIMGY